MTCKKISCNACMQSRNARVNIKFSRDSRVKTLAFFPESTEKAKWFNSHDMYTRSWKKYETMKMVKFLKSAAADGCAVVAVFFASSPLPPASLAALIWFFQLCFMPLQFSKQVAQKKTQNDCEKGVGNPDWWFPAHSEHQFVRTFLIPYHYTVSKSHRNL